MNSAIIGDVPDQPAGNIYSCPYCSEGLNPVELQQPVGIGGGTYCPKCQQRVYVSFPYAKLVAVLSLFLVCGILFLIGVRSILWLVTGTVVLWVPVSLFLNFYSTTFKRPLLRKWKPRMRRTFFEWLYERDQIRAPEFPNEDKKDS